MARELLSSGGVLALGIDRSLIHSSPENALSIACHAEFRRAGQDTGYVDSATQEVA
jgi:hypothetical protein